MTVTVEREGWDAAIELQRDRLRIHARIIIGNCRTERDYLIAEMRRLALAGHAADAREQMPCATPGCDQVCHPARPSNVYTHLGACCCMGHARALQEHAEDLISRLAKVIK